MKNVRYIKLQRKIIAITLLVALTPLIILGATIYFQFTVMYKDKIEEQIKYRSSAHAKSIGLFLKERTAILSAMADTHTLQELMDKNNLLRIFKIMNTRAGAFVDLGVIDNKGLHRSYVGPYELTGLNYYKQPWFAEVMNKDVYISDVYMGYRQLPHFIIAVRRQEGLKSWILRATIDSDIFEGIVRSAQVGKTGDAYVINKDGLFQTRPRFKGGILSESNLDTTLFGGTTTVNKPINDTGMKRLYAGSWLKNDKWLFIVSQDVSEEMSGLFATRNLEITIIVLGILGIVIATVFTTRMTVTHLEETDAKMNELNAQLSHSDKLAALGKLSASIAHEINNPLAVILQKTGWMEDLLDEEEFRQSKNFEEFKISIKKIEEHVERARRVVHNMLGYVRKMEPCLEDVDINKTIEQTIVILKNFAGINNIEIKTDLSTDLPIISGDQARFQQVFLNLISNAIDAIGKDGLIEVKSRKVNSRINVSIMDNGPGIAEEMQSKIFDPFITSKEQGKGTGLGLWVSYNIMDKLGGAITLESKVGKGAVFTVQIPIVYPEKK
ncbi:MAG: sensor histidine kinase [Candidatus Desulfaltia sp.]|nr:sensor histidine kinase [Candidatus Desulfaltia sp.]